MDLNICFSRWGLESSSCNALRKLLNVKSPSFQEDPHYKFVTREKNNPYRQSLNKTREKRGKGRP